MAGQAGAAPRNAPSAVRSRLPVYRSAAPSSMEAGFASRMQFKGQDRRSCLKLLRNALLKFGRDRASPSARSPRSFADTQYSLRAIVNADPTVVSDIEDIRVASPKTNIPIIVGFSRVDDLRRDDVVSGHHNHQRNVRCGKIVGIEPIERALLIEDMVERPAQGQRGVLILHQRKLVESSKRLALPGHDVLEQPQSGGGVADDVVALVGEANHQGRLALMA